MIVGGVLYYGTNHEKHLVVSVHGAVNSDNGIITASG